MFLPRRDIACGGILVSCFMFGTSKLKRCIVKCSGNFSIRYTDAFSRKTVKALAIQKATHYFSKSKKYMIMSCILTTLLVLNLIQTYGLFAILRAQCS